MVPVFHIVLVGDDESLRHSRDLILRNDGYEVDSVSSLAALNSPLDGRFDVAVISQSVTPSRAMRVAAALRQANPRIRILRVQAVSSQMEDGCDLCLENLSGPRAFLNAVRSLCPLEEPESTA
jgi:DNA-binding response OmpR family regulator